VMTWLGTGRGLRPAVEGTEIRRRVVILREVRAD
jgi:hypothetical protein